jgi:hypothetical protein
MQTQTFLKLDAVLGHVGGPAVVDTAPVCPRGWLKT